ncbi:MAG: hypothetical protein ACRBBP_07005 [Bdellovibrionales bacterium]
MKNIFLAALLSSQIGFALTLGNAELISNFMTMLTQDLQASDGEVLSLDCGDNPASTGIICSANIRLIDIVSNGSSQGGGEEVCTEVYTYTGSESFNTTCSTCEYSKRHNNYAQTCDVNFSKEDRYVADELITLLNESVYFGHILSYERPLFQASFNTDTGIIEIYKLTYTYPVYGEGDGYHNGEEAEEIIGQESKCEYITYDPDIRDYSLTDVSCDDPYTDVIDEGLIDEL